MSGYVWTHKRQPTRLPRPWDSPGKNTGVGCHFLLQCMKVKSESELAQSCPTLSDPMDCSLPCASVHGIFLTYHQIYTKWKLSSSNLVWFSRSVISNTLQPHGLQHARPPYPSPFPRARSNPCPMSRWCLPTISSSVIPFSSCLQLFPASESFPMNSPFPIRWPKYWSFSFSISLSNEYSGLISSRMDLLDLFAVQRTLKSVLQHQSSKASILQHSAFFTSNSHIHTRLLEKS